MSGFYDLGDISNNDVSGNNIIYIDNDLDLSDTTDLLLGIQRELSIIQDHIVQEPQTLSTDRSIAVDSLDCYYFRYNGEYVYIPYDKVQYIIRTDSNELVNISSGTISCYSLDRNGNVLNQYRLSPFSKPQEYQYIWNGQYNTWQWVDVTVQADTSNLTFGQTGLNNFDSIMLFGILFFVGIIALFRKGK